MIKNFKLFESDKLADKYLIDNIKKRNLIQVSNMINDPDCNINVRTYDKRTPLIIATQYEETTMIKELIEKGVKLDLQEETGKTALIEAAFRKNFTIIKILIDAGADYNIKDYHNYYFLDYLTPDKQEQVLKYYPDKFEEFRFKKNIEKYNL